MRVVIVIFSLLLVRWGAAQEPCTVEHTVASFGTWVTGWAPTSPFHPTVSRLNAYARIYAEYVDGHGYILHGRCGWAGSSWESYDEPMDSITAEIYPLAWPSEAWVHAAIAYRVRTDGVGSEAYCVFTNLVTNDWAIDFPNGGWGFNYSLDWLYEDHDGDGLNNLLDPDIDVGCWALGGGGDPTTWEWCTDVVIESDGEVEFLPETVVPGLPYVSGNPEKGYQCDVAYAFGGTFYPVGGTSDYFNEQYEPWRKLYFHNSSSFAVPPHPKPYLGAYNLLRGGAGGGQTAYFSAVWGKKLAYVNSAATSQGTLFSYTTSVYWHRYVVVGDRVWFQYWQPAQNCWRPFSVGWGSGVGSTNHLYGAAGGYKQDVDWGIATGFIPAGYFPSDVLADTESNVEAGEGTITNSVVRTWLNSVGGQTSVVRIEGGGGDGESLTQAEVAGAVFDAIRRASGGMAADHAAATLGQLGEGGVEGATGVFGSDAAMGSDGGAGAMLHDEGSAAGVAAEAGMRDALKLEEVAPVVQAEGLLYLELPRPGGGIIPVSISTLPDTSTPMGLAFEAMRVLLRLFGVAILTYKFSIMFMNVLKEFT